MNKMVKGVIIGSVIGIAIGLMDFNEVECLAKKYYKKGKKLIRNML